MTSITELVDFNSDWYSSANEEERRSFREWLLGVLQMHETVSITFVKKDGTLREMKCTLKEGIVPKIESPKTSDTLCTVWDTVLNQWRSFHFEKITKIDFTI